MTKKERWLRLHHYHFNHLVPVNLWDKVTEKFGGADASTKAFAHKLALKLRWNNRFALWAVHEYKRFVYLGVVSDFVVTPSGVIDQVWHQHILFSKAYRIFCTDVIEYEFDHTPELISTHTQTGTFTAQYLDTLALYKKEFGTDAPEAIWGTPKFDEEDSPVAIQPSKRKPVYAYDTGIDTTYYTDSPLCDSFDASAGENFGSFGGGDFGGAGAGGSWDSDSSDSSGDSSDSGGDGSDGGGDSSCSSCSSGCGGD